MRYFMSPTDQFPSYLSQLVALSSPCKEKDHVEVRLLNDPISATHRLILSLVLLVAPDLGGITLGGFRLPFQKRTVTIYVAAPALGRQVRPGLLIHELAHARQIFKLGAPLFFFLYIFCLPLGLTVRSKLEYDAYVAEAEFCLWYYEDTGRAWSIPFLFQKIMASKDYVWASTGKAARKAAIKMKQELSEISRHKRSGTTPTFHQLWLSPEDVTKLAKPKVKPPQTLPKS